jgi:hypothetical protein
LRLILLDKQAKTDHYPYPKKGFLTTSFVQNLQVHWLTSKVWQILDRS